MQDIVVIWDQLGQEPLRFFVTQNPRFLEMDRLYINTYTDDAEERAKLGELCALMYDDNGNCKQMMLDTFPCEVVRQGASVVVCGFLP